jgi:hypothetical protein
VTADRTNLVVKCGPLRNRLAEIDLCGGECLERLTAMIASPNFSTLEPADVRPDPKSAPLARRVVRTPSHIPAGNGSAPIPA